MKSISHHQHTTQVGKIKGEYIPIVVDYTSTIQLFLSSSSHSLLFLSCYHRSHHIHISQTENPLYRHPSFIHPSISISIPLQPTNTSQNARRALSSPMYKLYTISRQHNNNNNNRMIHPRDFFLCCKRERQMIVCMYRMYRKYDKDKKTP